MKGKPDFCHAELSCGCLLHIININGTPVYKKHNNKSQSGFQPLNNPTQIIWASWKHKPGKGDSMNKNSRLVFWQLEGYLLPRIKETLLQVPYLLSSSSFKVELEWTQKALTPCFCILYFLCASRRQWAPETLCPCQAPTTFSSSSLALWFQEWRKWTRSLKGFPGKFPDGPAVRLGTCTTGPGSDPWKPRSLPCSPPSLQNPSNKQLSCSG